MRRSLLLIKKLRQNLGKSFGTKEQHVVTQFVQQRGLGTAYHILVYYYEIVSGSVYDKKIVTSVISAAVLYDIAVQLKLTKLADRAKKHIATTIRLDHKKPLIAQSFPGSDSLENELLPVTRFITKLAGKQHMPLQGAFDQLLLLFERGLFLKRCAKVINQKVVNARPEFVEYLQSKVSSYSKLAPVSTKNASQKNLYENVKLYGIDIVVAAELRVIVKKMHNLLAEIDDILEDYPKTSIRMKARDKILHFIR